MFDLFRLTEVPVAGFALFSPSSTASHVLVTDAFRAV